MPRRVKLGGQGGADPPCIQKGGGLGEVAPPIILHPAGETLLLLPPAGAPGGLHYSPGPTTTSHYCPAGPPEGNT